MRSLFAGALALSASAGAMIAATESLGGQALAQTPQQGGTISRIVIEGNQRIEPRTIESYLLLKAGDPFDAERISTSFRTLFATGLFAEVFIERRGNDLVVRVLENAIVNRVTFEGNNVVTKERLGETVEIKPRDTFTRSRVEQDVQKILEAYRRAGRFAAVVTPTYKVLEQNRVDLIFEIDEGPSTAVRSINFLGNERFTDSRLRKEISTRESKWWEFFESRDNYNPAQVELDREKLHDFYTDAGYADFRVVSSVADLTPDRKDFYLTYTVEEGPEYQFGDVNVTTQLSKLSGDRLAQAVKQSLAMHDGDLFRSSLISRAMDAITLAAGSAGYANVDVIPRESRNPTTHKIDINFEVDEGPRVYIERIDITGNTQTLDRVIRREIRLAEGDVYNQVQLDLAKNRIRGLGFFADDSVTVTQQEGSSDDRAVVKVGVEEQPTGELTFSAGFSSADAFLFSASASNSNFRGRGQFLSAVIQTTSRQQQLQFNFTEPKFQDRNLAAGFDLRATRSDFAREAGFQNNVLGGTGRLLFPLSDNESIGLRYTLQQDDLQLDETLTDCSTTAFFRSSLCDQRGSRLSSAVGYTLSADHTNDPIEPTRGWRGTFSQDIAGIGGDVQYVRSEVRASTYYGLFPGIVASGRLEAGYIGSWGDEGIRVNNRFFKGGNDFRGFDYAGLGPREVRYSYSTETLALAPGTTPPGFSVPLLNSDGSQQTDSSGNLLFQSAVRDSNGNVQEPTVDSFNALGGKLYAVGSLELSFPVPYLPEEWGIDGALFSEFGTVGLLDKEDRDRTAGDAFTTFRVDDSASLRASAGVSIFWDSPFGPIRFDFSKILAKEAYDRTESFRFSTNTRF